MEKYFCCKMVKSAIISVSIWFLFVGCDWKPKFVRAMPEPPIDSNYFESILVTHTPIDTMEQIKMMLNYYDSVGMVLAELKVRNDINYYAMGFWRNTYATRKFYLDNDITMMCNRNKTSIGAVCLWNTKELGKCKRSGKWKIDVSINLGTEPDADYIGTNTRSYLLLDESDPDWWENNKNDELVQYFRKLQPDCYQSFQ